MKKKSITECLMFECIVYKKLLVTESVSGVCSISGIDNISITGCCHLLRVPFQTFQLASFHRDLFPLRFAVANHQVVEED